MPPQPDTINIRPAVAWDASAIRWLEEVAMKALAVELWGKWKPSPSLDLASHEMIERDSEVLGCIATRTGPDSLELLRLYLAPAHRNAGIGAVCLNEVLDRACAHDLPVTLRVLTNNPARRFYERHGFKVVERSQTHIQMIHTGPPTAQE